MDTDQEKARPNPDRLLATYLRDHLAAAGAGIALVGRCRKANDDNRVGEALAAVESEIVDDRRALVDLMGQLHVSPNRAKMAMAAAAEFVGRVKSNRTLSRYSPSSRVVELEGLIAGITAKRCLWSSMVHASNTRPELETAPFEELISRATSQISRLTVEHEWAAAIAFTHPAAR